MILSKEQVWAIRVEALKRHGIDTDSCVSAETWTAFFTTVRDELLKAGSDPLWVQIYAENWATFAQHDSTFPTAAERDATARIIADVFQLPPIAIAQISEVH